MPTVAGDFTVNGLPRDGAQVNLYYVSAAFSVNPPSGATIGTSLSAISNGTPFPPDTPVATTTTGPQHGSAGAYRFLAVPSAEYYVGVLWNGLYTWQYFNASQFSAPTSGALILNVGNSFIGSILALQQNGLNEFTVSESGELVINDTSIASGMIVVLQRNNVNQATIDTNGCLGIGAKPTSPVYPLEIIPQNGAAPVRVAVHYDWVATSGNMGVIIDKRDKTSGVSQGITWMVGGHACWDLGMDVATNNTDGVAASGNSDFVLLYDYTSGWDDNGNRIAKAGADIVRFTPAEKSFTGKCTSWQIAGQAAGRNTTSSFGQIVAGAGMTGLEISAYTKGLFHHLLFTSRTPLVPASGGGTYANECLINYNQQWIAGLDYGAQGTRNLVWVDNQTTSPNKTRIYLEGTNNPIARLALNTNAPLGYFHIQSDSLSGSFQTIQTLFTAGYSAGDLGNRRVNLQQILRIDTATNWLLFNGQLHASSTATSGVFTGGTPMTLGIEASDNGLAIFSAAHTSGAIAAQRVIKVSNSQDSNNSGQLAFYDGSPIAKQTLTGVKSGGTALINLISVLVNLGLLIDQTT